MSADGEPDGSGLQRRLGARDGAAVVISNVIGTGIFLTPALIAQRVDSGPTFLALWVVGGALAVIGALSYAELAAMRPRAGGEYVYIREAFGSLAGFLSGWTSLVAGFSGAIAAAAVGFAIYLDRLVPGAGSTEALGSIPAALGEVGLRITPRSLVAVAVIVVFSVVHARGLGPGRLTQQALAWLNVATLLVLIGVGFAAAGAGAGAGVGVGGEAGNAAVDGRGGVLVALVLVMFTYSGWNAAAYVAGEARDPDRTLPRSLVGGTLVVTALYLALNLLYLQVLGPAGVAASPATGDRLASSLWGSAGVLLVTPLILLVLMSSVSAMVLTGPRVYFAMARDRCLPGAFGEVRRTGVPARGIGLQAAWSVLLVLTGGFEALLTYTGFAIVLFAGLGVAALFVLRRRRPHARRPFRVPGYPWAPALFIAASVAMVAQSIARAPVPSLVGVGVMAAGIPVYARMRRRTRSDAPGDSAPGEES